MTEYTKEAVIEKPMHEVVQLFGDHRNFTEWQPELVAYDTFEGDPCCEGARSRLKYDKGRGGSVKMVEKVLKSDLPEEYRVEYDTDGVKNYQTHHFEAINEDKTMYRVKSEYDTDGLMKIASKLNLDHFEKDTENFVQSFKHYAEKKL